MEQSDICDLMLNIIHYFVCIAAFEIFQLVVIKNGETVVFRSHSLCHVNVLLNFLLESAACSRTNHVPSLIFSKQTWIILVNLEAWW